MPVFAENKQARFDYEVVETLEAGIVLRGHEAKAVRAGKVSLRGAHARIRDGRLLLINALISPYQQNNTPETYDDRRDRVLLVHKKELNRLIGIEKRKGLTLVPIKMYNSKGKVKIAIALAQGKKKFDKRESIKKRDFDRKKDRALRGKE